MTPEQQQKELERLQQEAKILGEVGENLQTVVSNLVNPKVDPDQLIFEQPQIAEQLDKFQKGAENIVQGANNLGSAAQEQLADQMEAINEGMKKINSFQQSLQEGVKAGGEQLRSMFGNIGATVRLLLSSIKALLKGVANALGLKSEAPKPEEPKEPPPSPGSGM